MKKGLLIGFIVLMQSCQIFDKQVPDEKELLKKELKAINWNQVDEYPTIENCEQLADKTKRKQCFFEFMAQTIQQKLNVDSVTIAHPKSDTIQVLVTVLTDATLEFKSRFVQDSLVFSQQKVDSILKLKLINFPKINPAIKRGIPVKAQFILPVILHHE